MVEVIIMLKISSTEFKNNMAKYLTILDKEEIILTKNGKPVAKLIPTENKNIVSQLTGIIPNDGYTIKKAKKDRISKYEDTNR
jgi:prevent-host-death family protein